MKVLACIIKKEFIHIWRDPQTLTIIILMPLLMLLLYGYAITFEMKQINTVIVDFSRTPQSRSYIKKIISTDFFHITDFDVPYKDIENIFFSHKARCVIVIPEIFSENLDREASTPVQLLIDASDPNAANFINNYITQINMRYNLERYGQSIALFSVESRFLYNPNLKSAYFFVPGLVAVIILLISALLTSIAIVREKEMGTMEQVLVSPVKPNQIIFGKLIPYMGLSFLDSVLILLCAHFMFQVPIRGSLILLGLTLVLYILTGLSFGLLISTGTRSQQIAMMATLVITILPSFMLSGFIFPVRSMPLVFQWFSKIVPATHFLIIIRGIVLKGVGMQVLLKQMVYLVCFSLIVVSISLKKFRTNLE
jgi:ABC-2 type transport system permease protein